MNDPNKRIDVNLSSLMSLKAELLRKQAEVNKAKVTRSIDNFVPSQMTSSTTETKKDKKENLKELIKDKDVKVYEHEDTALLEKSQKVLVAKSKYYDRMTKSGGKLNSDDNCLVLFNRKKQEKPSETIARRLSISSSSEDDKYNSEDEELVEYTDCLGRTRKCPRSSLEFVKKKDSELAASMPERLDQSAPNWMLNPSPSATSSVINTSESLFTDGLSVMSKHDTMRCNWEKKEVENLGKTDVHYQDVFFDEARQHGVGYYAFSTDEEERARQQRELEETRKRTLAQQEEKDAQRAHRDNIIAERVLAAKNRQRARLGLPPLEKLEGSLENGDSKNKTETKAERKLRKREEKRKRKLEEEAKIREEERQNHVRPWDKGKSGKRRPQDYYSDSDDEEEWRYVPERTPMSQEQWNDIKRAERKQEFAPPPPKTIRTQFRSIPPPMPPPEMVPPPPMFPSDKFYNIEQNNFASIQTTKPTFQRRNYKSDEPEMHYRSGATIPPPAELYRPSSPTDSHYNYSANDGLERSIEAGLKFLRNHSDKGTLSTKSSWTTKADY